MSGKGLSFLQAVPFLLLTGEHVALMNAANLNVVLRKCGSVNLPGVIL
uniref:Uncharacterized protein n=1 Tax=Rhodnius prolixus TaxID=13249 RepID=T1HSD5_RHOPR